MPFQHLSMHSVSDRANQNIFISSHQVGLWPIAISTKFIGSDLYLLLSDNLPPTLFICFVAVFYQWHCNNCQEIGGA